MADACGSRRRSSRPTASRSAFSSINVDMRRAFDRVRSSVRPGETIYVVNKQGDYLVHPDPSREFGSQLGRPTDWRSRLPGFGGARRRHARQSRDIVPDRSRTAGRRSARARPSGRQRMGRRHRNRSQRRLHGAGGGDPKYLASGRTDRGVVRGGAGASDREVADPADRPIDRSRRGRRPATARPPFRSTRAARPACWRARLRR